MWIIVALGMFLNGQNVRIQVSCPIEELLKSRTISKRNTKCCKLPIYSELYRAEICRMSMAEKFFSRREFGIFIWTKMKTENHLSRKEKFVWCKEQIEESISFTCLKTKQFCRRFCSIVESTNIQNEIDSSSKSSRDPSWWAKCRKSESKVQLLFFLCRETCSMRLMRNRPDYDGEIPLRGYAVGSIGRLSKRTTTVKKQIEKLGGTFAPNIDETVDVIVSTQGKISFCRMLSKCFPRWSK